MKIELLKTFIEVSETLHFRVASENLFITQSAVSARIKQLEEELGVLLFDRSHKHMKLTPEGHRLIKHAKEMLLMWQKVKQDVGIADSSSTQLFVGSMMAIWDIVLQDWLKKIHRNLDDVSLFTNTYSPTDLRKNILNRLVDLAFLFEPPFIEDLVTEKVTTVPLYLVSTDKYADITQLDNMVMVDYGEAINSQFMRDFSHLSTIRHFMSQPRIAMNFIIDAGGCALLPRQMCFEYLSKNKLHIVKDAKTYSRDVYAIYLAKSQKSEIIHHALQLFPYVAS
ncbi:MAG: LysR family transcriptional regulator [Thalassotalea sp.]